MVSVQLPSQLSGLADGRNRLQVRASTLGEVFRKLDEEAPMIRSQIFDATGSIRQFVSVFLNERQISAVGDGMQPVQAGSEVLIVMAVAGG
jgi:sulfur-carrier protein